MKNHARVGRWGAWVAALAVLALQVGCLLPARPHPPGLYTADEQGRLVLLLSGCHSYSELRFEDRTDAQGGQPGETVWQLERGDTAAAPTRIVVGEVPDGYSETVRDPRLEEHAQVSSINVMDGQFSVLIGGSAQAVEAVGEVHRGRDEVLTVEQVSEHFDEHC